MMRMTRRLLLSFLACMTMGSVSCVTFADTTGGDSLNTGDTSWILASSALVLLMTPGVAFFMGDSLERKMS
jgi:hypothetical protein